MPKARVTQLNVAKKVNRIVRENDSTTDLARGEMAVKGRMHARRIPDGVRKGSFDPSANTGHNGNTVIQP